MACLLASAAFAAWSWLKPYAWNPDPAARCIILETLVSRDHSFFWVDVHLRLHPESTHDLQKPVLLETAAGNKLEPADTTFGGIEGREPNEIWFRFWVEPKDLAGPVHLVLNDGRLSVKSNHSIPDLGNSTYRNFTSNRW